MKLSQILPALAVAGLLPAAPARAAEVPAGGSAADTSPVTRPASGPSDRATSPMTAATETPESPTIEGTIAAIDHDSGRFVLDTDDGPVTLRSTPDQLAGVAVGDVVRVSLIAIQSPD
jgi:hypothetical protein